MAYYDDDTIRIDAVCRDHAGSTMNLTGATVTCVAQATAQPAISGLVTITGAEVGEVECVFGAGTFVGKHGGYTLYVQVTKTGTLTTASVTTFTVLQTP